MTQDSAPSSGAPTALIKRFETLWRPVVSKKANLRGIAFGWFANGWSAALAERVDEPPSEPIALLDKIESYPFESQGGDLRNCVDWHALRSALSAKPGAPTAPTEERFETWFYEQFDRDAWSRRIAAHKGYLEGWRAALAERVDEPSASERDRVWSNRVLEEIARHFPHIPTSEHGDEARANLMRFARALPSVHPVEPAALPKGKT